MKNSGFAVALEDAEADARRAEAVLETRRLRSLLAEGRLSKSAYLKHLKELTIYVNHGPLHELEAPTRTISGVQLKTPSLDAILISFLLGENTYEKSKEKRLLGNW